MVYLVEIRYFYEIYVDYVLCWCLFVCVWRFCVGVQFFDFVCWFFYDLDWVDWWYG